MDKQHQPIFIRECIFFPTHEASAERLFPAQVSPGLVRPCEGVEDIDGPSIDGRTI